MNPPTPTGRTAQSTHETARILVVDDEPGIRQSLCGVLEDEGYAVQRRRKRRRRAWRRSRALSFELVLLDIWLPGIDGMETLRASRRCRFAERPEW